MAKDLPITTSGLTAKEFQKRYGFDPLKEVKPSSDRYNWKLQKVQQWRKDKLKIAKK